MGLDFLIFFQGSHRDFGLLWYYTSTKHATNKKLSFCSIISTNYLKSTKKFSFGQKMSVRGAISQNQLIEIL